MLSSTYEKNPNDIETTNQLFKQLSISLDSRLARHKNASPRPRLKRLLKIKYSSSLNSNSAFCSRCKRETLKGTKHDQHSTPEKEVQVEKESLHLQLKKVIFADFFYNEEKKDEKVEKHHHSPVFHEERFDQELTLSESAPIFQSVFFAHRPSIIGNNEFWLPQYSSLHENVPSTAASTESPISSVIPEVSYLQKNPSNDDASISDSNGLIKDDVHEHGLTIFFRNIFQETSKAEVKVLKVVELIGGTLAALTEEHFFQCQYDNHSYRVLDAIALRDIRRLLVNDNCLMLVLEIERASTLNEYKEFVPGYAEKTESLVSRMVYALSRIKHFLPDVTRLPIHMLPTCASVATWLVKQNENVLYSGIVAAENISYLDHELLDENFMMKTAKNEQFHPVRIMVKAGYIMSACNGGCESTKCNYALSLELKNEITRIKRESHPWPNSFRISTENDDILLSSSSMASVNDLLEKLYFVLQSKNENSLKQYALVFVTEFFLQLFSMKGRDKDFLCGFPILNLDIKSETGEDCTCTIDSEGFEADDTDVLQNRWKLEFLSSDEKMKFLAETSKLLV